MSDTSPVSISEYVRWRCETKPSVHDRTGLAKFLFTAAGVLIQATDPTPERLRFPFYGETPFYQDKRSEVTIIDRLATDTLTLTPYYEPDSDAHKTTSMRLAIDTRRQYKRNKLPVPLAWGKIALSSTVYKDKVLRLIESDGEDPEFMDFESEPLILRRESSLLMSNIGYRQVPLCLAPDAEMIEIAEGIETMSRLLGTHNIVLEAVNRASYRKGERPENF